MGRMALNMQKHLYEFVAKSLINSGQRKIFILKYEVGNGKTDEYINIIEPYSLFILCYDKPMAFSVITEIVPIKYKDQPNYLQ